jgi:hypothetical protein
MFRPRRAPFNQAQRLLPRPYLTTSSNPARRVPARPKGVTHGNSLSDRFLPTADMPTADTKTPSRQGRGRGF